MHWWKKTDFVDQRFHWKVAQLGRKFLAGNAHQRFQKKNFIGLGKSPFNLFFSLPLSHSLSHARTRSLLQYNSLFTHIDLSHSLSLHIETCTYTLKNTNRYTIHISSQPSVCTYTHTQTNTFILINTHSLPHTILLFSLYLHSNPHNILTLSNSWCNLKRP